MRKKLPKTSEIDRLAEVAAETVTSAEAITCSTIAAKIKVFSLGK